MPFKYYNNKMQLHPISARKPKSQTKDLGKNQFHVNTYETPIALPEGGEIRYNGLRGGLDILKRDNKRHQLNGEGIVGKR